MSEPTKKRKHSYEAGALSSLLLESSNKKTKIVDAASFFSATPVVQSTIPVAPSSSDEDSDHEENDQGQKSEVDHQSNNVAAAAVAAQQRENEDHVAELRHDMLGPGSGDWVAMYAVEMDSEGDVSDYLPEDPAELERIIAEEEEGHQLAPVVCPEGLDPNTFDPTTTLFVRNLSFDVDEAKLGIFFSERGVELTGCHCERNSSGRLAGFAYVQVRDERISTSTVAAAAEANSGDGEEWHLLDRQVRVSVFDAEALQRRQNKKKKKKKKIPSMQSGGSGGSRGNGRGRDGAGVRSNRDGNRGGRGGRSGRGGQSSGHSGNRGGSGGSGVRVWKRGGGSFGGGRGSFGGGRGRGGSGRGRGGSGRGRGGSGRGRGGGGGSRGRGGGDNSNWRR